MYDLFKLIDSFISKGTQKNPMPNLYNCLRLHKAGWTIVGYTPIPNSSNLGVCMRFGDQQTTISLGITEQALWLKHLEEFNAPKSI
jgi:hypothetical protein